jgi:hypothetical protein
MILRPSLVSTKQFTFVKDERLLVAEASSLPEFGRVYSDACDEGLTVVSHHTGREVVYVVNAVHKDREGDLTHWDLIPASGGTGLPNLRVFND